jgi:Ca2+:H+ antiporter
LGEFTLFVVGNDDNNPGSVLALTIPAAFFAAIDSANNNGSQGATGPSDTLRDDFLRISRGFAVILLVMCAPPLFFFYQRSDPSRPGADSYVGSRFYLHDPPGANNAFSPHPDVPLEVLRREQELKEAKPEVNPWACLILLVVTVALMAVTAVFVRQPTPFPIFHANVLTVFPPRSSSTA